MTENFRSPYEIEDAENSQSKDNSAPKASKSKVDSLVDHEIGAITVGSGGKKSEGLKKSIHKFWSKGMELWPTTRKQKIVGSLIVVLVLALGAGGVYALTQMFKSKPEPPQEVVYQEPKTHEPSKLTGVEVGLDVNKKRVIAIMIENSPDARPQAGLRDSGVVFEAIAEGGITRFLTLHLEDKPKYIGPVRSVRPYYAEWAAGFDAAIGHAGGSGDGLAMVRRLKLSDMDYTKANAYRRVSDRYAPHNLYTDMASLRKELKRLGYARPSEFTGFDRKTESKVDKATVKHMSFSISGALYDTKYAYDQKTNSYKRFLAGQPHRDHRSGKQISPKVVIAMVMRYSQNGIYSVYRTKGTGQVIVFQDGKAQKGTWKKAGPKEPLKFFDADGNPLRLNPGQTWITALKNSGEVRYGP